MSFKSQSGTNSGYFKQTNVNATLSDIKPIARGELTRIKRDAKKSIATDTLTRYCKTNGKYLRSNVVL